MRRVSSFVHSTTHNVFGWPPGAEQYQYIEIKVLEGRTVVLFPDLWTEEKWWPSAAFIPYFRECSIYAGPRKIETAEGIAKGLDIGVYLL